MFSALCECVRECWPEVGNLYHLSVQMCMISPGGIPNLVCVCQTVGIYLALGLES